MQTFQFKTSLKCNGCVSAIKPGIDTIKGIKSWRVFLDVQDNILQVDCDDSSEDEIVNAVQNAVTKAGYKIERI